MITITENHLAGNKNHVHPIDLISSTVHTNEIQLLLNDHLVIIILPLDSTNHNTAHIPNNLFHPSMIILRHNPFLKIICVGQLLHTFQSLLVKLHEINDSLSSMLLPLPHASLVSTFSKLLKRKSNSNVGTHLHIG